MNDLGRVGVIVAARMGSSRLPGKALKPLHGIPMLAFLLRRIQSSNSADEIVLCTSVRTDDTVLAELANTEGVGVYRGALDDVADRYVSTAREYKIDTVVRITGDCPFVDGELIDHCVSGIRDTAENHPERSKGHVIRRGSCFRRGPDRAWTYRA
ncbi:MAG TPA: hypothetical protein EYN74_09250 [Nitrospirales bacterium]|nr:hypothetical protein [Nitrospirales bacterium]